MTQAANQNAKSGGTHRPAQQQRTGTMPPPELLDRPAPTSVGSLVLARIRADEPVTRHQGKRADVAYLRARVAKAHAAENKDEEREAAASLAELLASRETELDTAINLATRALELGDDPGLRTELAAWQAGLGDIKQAAKTLRLSCRPENPVMSAQMLIQVAVLLARSGDALGAAEVLQESARLDKTQPLALELIGTIAAWAPKDVSASAAAAGYLAAASRHEALADLDSALEDRLRAFEIASEDETTANAMAAALSAREAYGTADEALREHAVALAQTNRYRARQVHLKRATISLDRGSPARAVGAVIDAGILAEIEGDLGQLTDRVLTSAGLDALVAIRKEMRQKGGSLAAIAARTQGGPEVNAAALLQAMQGASKERERADALVKIAAGTRGELAAVLLSIAADYYLTLDQSALARRAAEDACLSEPSSARALSVLSRATIAMPDVDAAAAVEGGALSMLVRGSICEGMARALESLGEMAQALTWTQRWLALRPGNPDAMRELVRRASQAYDPDRLDDALGWVLAQPRPLDDMSSTFGDALELLFELDPPRALDIARRALDLYGPRVPGLRGRIVAMSDRAGDAALGVSLLERLVSADSGKDPRAVERLFDIAQRRAAAGDWDGAAAELARAGDRGASSRLLHEHLDALEDKLQAAGAELGSDGLVSFVEARVRALSALLDGPEQSQLENLSNALRELGSIRWDLAQDPVGAEDAFFRAAIAAPQGGLERYARDLVTFAGPEDGFDPIIKRADSLANEPRRRASLLIEAASLAYAHQNFRRALEISASAIQVDPSRADAVAIVEKACKVDGGIQILDRTYDVLASAALGCYGRRAAHYRGARQLERRGAIDEALRHAVASFEAVPSEGTSYVLMARLAERAGDPTEAIKAIERVAETVEGPARAAWLKRGALLTNDTLEGVRLRFDLLLRALVARPDVGTVEEAGGVVRRLASKGEDLGLLSVRFERAALAALRHTDGPDGARAAVTLAKVAMGTLSAQKLGLSLLERAVAADGDIDEYASLVDLAPLIARGDGNATRTFLETVLGIVARPYSSVGSALLRLASTLAREVGDEVSAAGLLVQAAKRASEDDALVCDAEAAVSAAGDASLRHELDDAIPPAERLAALLRVAERKEREGAWTDAIHALERALRSPLLSAEQRSACLSSIRRLFVLAERAVDAEAVLAAELEREDLEPAVRVRRALDLSALLVARSEDTDALAVLKKVLTDEEHDEELLATTLRLARRTGERSTQVTILNKLLDKASDDGERAAILRELAVLLSELDEPAASIAHFRAAVDLNPADASALEALEAHAAETGNHEELAELLGKRIQASEGPELRRTLRLRRAAVLEQRLGKLDDACKELEAILAENPDDVSALRFLADICERLTKPLRAAPLWQKLGELSSKTDERAEYGVRAANNYLAGGDAAAARAIVESIAPIAARDTVIELRVSIAKQQGDLRTVSESLDMLATTSREPAERRASYLVEAARSAASIGDEAGALDRIRRAVRLAPNMAEAVLEARRLEYRARGGGTPREAQMAIDELTRIADRLSPEQLELQAFLLAEELDVIQGGGAGMRELSRRHAEIGPAPLIALGMAERLVRNRAFDAALPLFERALTGDLRGLRSRGRVALSGADAAMQAGQVEAASRLLSVASQEPDTRPLAMRKKLELVAGYGEPDAARVALEDLIRQSAGLDRARFMLQLGRLIVATDQDEAIRLFADAFPFAAADRALSAQIADELRNVRRPDRSSEEPLEKAQSPKAQPPEIALQLELDDLDGLPEDDDDDIPIPLANVRQVGNLAAQQKQAPKPAEPVQVARPKASPEPALVDRPAKVIVPIAGASTARESALLAELGAGSFDAGERLAETFAASGAERARDLLAVRQQQAALRPGDRSTLEKLRDAAALDRNTPFVSALEHILCGFDSSAKPVAPPPLSSLAEAPEQLAALLFRSGDSAINEALAITWETGRYRREPVHYGLTGALRVQPGAPTVLGEVYGAVTRVFGASRTPLFHRRPAPNVHAQPGSYTVTVALLAPPAIVLSGELREETPELRYMLGAALAGAMPEHVLARGLPEEHLRTLIDALRAAFGPVGPTAKTDPGVARLGQDLCQIVPPRGYRRLREIFAQEDATTYEVARDVARRATRRAGLFACGDLPTALRLCMTELGITLAAPIQSEGGLARACAAHPALSDLVRLASRSEYAEARWHALSSTDDTASRRFRGMH